MQKIAIGFLGISLGLVLGYLLVFHTVLLSTAAKKETSQKKQVIGFLPYWLLGSAKKDYSHDITTLSYFSLGINPDGSIHKLASEQEEDPGWYALASGKLEPFFATARSKNIHLSLVIFSSDAGTIDVLMADPIAHADTLSADVLPVLKKYQFSDLNLDIERSGDASSSTQFAYAQFLQEVKKNLAKEQAATLTVDISPADLIRQAMAKPENIGKIADHVILMTYDYHASGSSVTGPIAPLGGAGIISEYDIEAAVQKALAAIPAGKIIVGIPLYGYEWETLTTASHAAVISGTGIIASNRRVEKLLQSCATCSAQFDEDAQESYLVYKDTQTGTYHQIYFPDERATQAKVNYALQENLGGIALWALGYEGNSILSPLQTYKQ